MANHLTPEELAKEMGMDRDEVIRICIEEGVPIYHGKIDKYLFTVTARRDGSSRFGANNKWAFFPSGAFAWRVIDEPFLRDQSFFSDLKLRISYGRTGNQAHFGAVGFCVSVKGRAGTNVGEVDGLGEDRFHGAGPGVVNKPIDLSSGAEPFLEPAFPLPGKVMRYQSLGVGDVREMADA